MFYTYLHLRESDSKPFYVGKGQGKRAWAHRNRNLHWKNTVAKHGLKVEICAEWPTEAEAFEHERFLIACFRDMGHNLVNLTDGGEGPSGMKCSEETKAVLRAKAVKQFESGDAAAHLSRLATERFKDPAERSAASERSKEVMSREGMVDVISLSTKAAMAHPEVKLNCAKGIAKREQNESYLQSRFRPCSEEKKLKIGRSQSIRLSDPDVLKAHGEIRKGKVQSAETKAKRVATWEAKRLAGTAAHSESHSLKAKLNWADPEFRAKMLEARAAKRAAKSQE